MQLGAVFALHLLLKRGGDQAGGREPLGFHERLLGRRFGTVLASGERARHDHDADYTKTPIMTRKNTESTPSRYALDSAALALVSASPVSSPESICA